MSIKDKYFVQPVTKADYAGWILKKHYAHRMPSVMFAFGLYNEGLVGVCIFAMTPNYVEMEAWKPYDLLELSRLCVNDGLGKNVLSYFVSQSIKLLPSPTVLISYSDIDWGHHGYIYQATNWLYTGVGGQGSRKFVLKGGDELHQRHSDKIPDDMIENIEHSKGKHRYYYFHGNKTDKKKMRKMLRYDVLPYPKGDNKRYDASYEPEVQNLLF